MPDYFAETVLRRGRKAWAHLELLHVVGYFAPEPRAAYEALGLRGRATYFAPRAAALGPVGAPVVVAAFFNFAPRGVEGVLPQAWQVASPEQVLAARYDGVGAALRRILADRDEASVAEAAELARIATEPLSPYGRTVYAAHAALPWPDDPLLALWHAATLLREHRGDGHIAALVGAGLGPVEALVLNGLAMGSTDFLVERRGWRPEQWEAARTALREQGLLTDEEEPTLSDEGRDLVERLEVGTDRASAAGWAHLGPERTARLVELVGPWRRAVVADEHTPAWLRGRR